VQDVVVFEGGGAKPDEVVKVEGMVLLMGFARTEQVTRLKLRLNFHNTNTRPTKIR
jgi:hypothetical protein